MTPHAVWGKKVMLEEISADLTLYAPGMGTDRKPIPFWSDSPTVVVKTCTTKARSTYHSSYGARGKGWTTIKMELT